MNFSKWALDNSKLINFLVVILVVGGLMAYNSMSKLEDPAIKVKQAMVITTYPGASASQVRDDFGDVYGMFYALKGDGQSDKELNDYAEMIKRSVSEIDGVSRVEIYGKRNQCVNIELREDKMANLGVMPTEVIMTLNNQNKTIRGMMTTSCALRILPLW